MKHKKWLIGIAAILLVFLIVASGLLRIPTTLSSRYGITVLSLDKIDMKSSFSFLDGEEVFVVTAKLDGLSQTVQGLDVESDDINSYTDKFTRHDFEIDVENIEQSCVYDINEAPEDFPVVEFYSNTWYCLYSASFSRAQEECNTGILFAYGKFTPPSVTCGCVGGSIEGMPGELESLPDVSTEFDVVVTRDDGQTDRETFNTLTGETRGEIGDNAYSVWQGNLDTGRACAGTEGRMTMYVDGAWVVTSSSDYDFYLDKVDRENLANLEEITAAGWDDADEMEDAIDEINARADNAISEETFGRIENEMEYNDGRVEKTLSNSLAQSPIITLYVKADWLGVYTPIPAPEIVRVDSSCFLTGEDGEIIVRVKNVGEERGNIEVTASCPSPFSAKRADITLYPGESGNVYLELSATTSTRRERDCTVTASAGDDSVTASVGVCVDPQQVCTPNEKVCLDGDVKQCNSDGSAYTLVDECIGDEECVVTSSGPKCQAEDLPRECWLTADCPAGEKCSSGVCVSIGAGVSWFDKLLRYAKYILIVCGLVVVGIVVYKIYKAVAQIGRRR